MTIATINFTARNNDDWTRTFQLLSSAGFNPLWSNVAPWTANTAYQSNVPASVVVYNGDLYVANAATNQGAFTSGTVFDPTQFVKVGDSRGYGRIPYDLTECSLKMGVALSGTTLTLSSDLGGLIIVNPSQGTWRFDYPFLKASVVPGGTYPFDMVIIRNGRRVPALKGTLAIDAGITP